MQITFSEAPTSPEILLNMDIITGATTLLGDSAHSARVVEDGEGNRWILKAKDVSYEKAVNEASMLRQFAIDGIPTLPFKHRESRVVRIGQNSAALLLPFIEGLQPLTRLNWKTYVGTPEYCIGQQALLDCLSLAVKMHKRGYVHGDFQVKNIGTLPSGKMLAFDLENANSTRHMTHEAATSAKVEDVVSLFKSAILNGFLDDTTDTIASHEIDNLLQFYVDKWVTGAHYTDQSSKDALEESLLNVIMDASDSILK